jgi:hypothetical protein
MTKNIPLSTLCPQFQGVELAKHSHVKIRCSEAEELDYTDHITIAIVN